MAFYKNVASQKIAVFAYDSTDGSAKTGDAANITAQISKDGGAAAATNDTNPTELDATDHPGVYLFDMLQAESNADLVNLSAVSATGDILLEPVFIYTTPGDSTALAADAIEISGDSTAADNAEAFFDGTGYAGTNNVIPTVTTLTGHTAQTGDSFARIGAAGAGLTNIDLPNQTMDIVGSITGNLSGSVGSVTGAVGSVTGAVGSVTGNVGGDVQGNVDGSVASVAGAVGSVTGAVGSVTGAVGSVTGNVGGNVVGSVGSVTGAVGSVTAEVSADMTKISGSATAADNLEASALGVFKGAATSNGTTTTLIDTTLGARDDTWIGRTVVITGGTLVNEATDITDYDQATKTLTFTALTGATTSGDTYVIV